MAFAPALADAPARAVAPAPALVVPLAAALALAPAPNLTLASVLAFLVSPALAPREDWHQSVSFIRGKVSNEWGKGLLPCRLDMEIFDSSAFRA